MEGSAKFDFDREINRYDKYSIKYDPVSRGKPADVLPMWVADMDFPAPECVTDALADYSNFGIFGYSEPDAAYHDVIGDWFLRRFGWQVQREWTAITPGVVNAIYIAVRALTNPGDGVVIQQPVYYPFESAVRHTGRKLLVNQLTYEDGRYGIDFADFEEKISRAKMFILCSPHNPVGRVWMCEELTRMGEICKRYNVPVVADEIWQDFVFERHKHHVFSAISPDFADFTITATAPSKTFNLAGLQHANIFIPNAKLREKFMREYIACGLSQPSLMGLVSCKAAYEHGETWLAELLLYLAGNMRLVHEFFAERVPKVRTISAEGTYLAWLDCAALENENLESDITHKGKLWISDGAKFGVGGKNFMRINVACPRKTLKEGLDRFESAVK